MAFVKQLIVVFTCWFLSGLNKLLSLFSFQLQQIEQAQLQQREANLTALAAIGPRRKRPLEQTESQVGLCVTGFCVENKISRFM